MSELEKYVAQVNFAAQASTKSISQAIIDALTSYNQVMATQHPAPSPRGKVLRQGEWVWIRELSVEEREDHWKSYTDDELHDTADSILDELSSREKKRQQHERPR